VRIGESTPLLVDLSSFDNFQDYFSSLDKKSRKSLLPSLKKNSNTVHSEIPLDPGILGDFMRMWETQPLHDGSFPRWGNWSPESIIDLHENTPANVVLFSISMDSQIVCLHFVFVWEGYVYCNSPLYNKSRFSHLEISKFAWLKLFEWAIGSGMRYIDMCGPYWLPNSWNSVKANKQPGNEPGDFGYKWKLVPEDQKNVISDPDLSVTFCDSCGYRGVYYEGGKICNCRMKDILIVAHPDDEAIFFGNWLIKNKGSVRVICVTGGSDLIRKGEFLKVMGRLGISEYEIWDMNMSLLPFSQAETDEIRYRFRNILESEDISRIITHSSYGEYGHFQHILINRMVSEIFPTEKIWVYDISASAIKPDESLSKMEICKIYRSQWDTGVMEIKNSLCTGSDWYKHTVGFNMIDHESIIPLSESVSKFSACVINPKSITNYPFYDFFFELSKRLSDLGHRVEIMDSPSEDTEVDIHICFLPEDAEILSSKGIPYFFIVPDDTFLDDDHRSLDQEALKRSIVGSVRSSVRTKKLRNYLGNFLNLVYIPNYRPWEEIVMDFESNILMGIKWKILSNYKNLDSPKDPVSDYFHDGTGTMDFLYTGPSINSCVVSLLDSSGTMVSYYELNLISGQRYWIGIDPRFFKEPFTLVCKGVDSYETIWTQNIVF